MIYSCTCRKCKNKFDSENEVDLDGDGLCVPCFEEKKVIAAQIDAKISSSQNIAKPELPYTERVIGGILVRTYYNRPEDCVSGTNYMK